MKQSRMVLALALVVCALTAGRAGADEQDSQSLSMFNGPTVVKPLDYIGWKVTPDFALMDAPTISGQFRAAGGSGNDIRVLVLTDTDLLNWRNDHPTQPLYDSGQVTAADLSVRLPAARAYYVVLSNVFSTFTPKTVEGELHLTWQPSAAVLAKRKAIEDAQRAVVAAQERRAKTTLVLWITGLTTMCVAGGGVVGYLATRQQKDSAESEKARSVA